MKKKYILKLKTALALLVLVGLHQRVMAQTMATINISEDTYVQGSSVGTNYGADVEARVRDTATSAPRITYYKFPVISGLPSSVTSATLKFHTYLPSSTGTTEILQIHKLTNAWSESVVTYDTKPDTGAFISELTINSVPVTSPNDYSNSYMVDVTAYFNQVLAASGTDISFAIKAKNIDEGGNEKLVRLATKEAGGAVAATITINYILGVDDIKKTELPLVIYPNPTKSSFILNRTFKSADMLDVSIFNILGVRVSSFKEIVQPGVWNKELNVQDFKMGSGIYMVKLTSQSNGSAVSKLVIE
ncbi:CBM96 family carbohydrate-binding protein [Formosa haliotis]|uniref:CBM96 family carbohydrate-binding protein n=1 Tax=Formosa haliotis TaxID=1555194 RepID=UPI000825A957|nr:DNRLRE domain-containing protein [Formosa haliotis]